MMLCKKLDETELKVFAKVNTDWVAEVKEDGDRVRMTIKDEVITLTNRRGNVITDKYPEFTTVKLPNMILDGEMCVLNDKGVSIFNEGISFRTHCKDVNTIREASDKYPVTFVVFDMLEVEDLDLAEKPYNRNIRVEPYTFRREILEQANIESSHANIKLVEQSTEIIELWEETVNNKGEGIILKHKSSTYDEGKRSPNWLKVKDVRETDVRFTKFTEHPKGIRCQTDDENITITVNGYQSQEVKHRITNTGSCTIGVRHLGDVTANGKLRQPVMGPLK